MIIDTYRLAAAIRARYGVERLADAAEELGLEAALLERIERGEIPDVRTLKLISQKINRWLNESED